MDNALVLIFNISLACFLAGLGVCFAWSFDINIHPIIKKYVKIIIPISLILCIISMNASMNIQAEKRKTEALKTQPSQQQTVATTSTTPPKIPETTTQTNVTLPEMQKIKVTTEPSPKSSDVGELDGLIFTDFRVEASPKYKTYDVFFSIVNNGDRVKNIYQSDFAIRREGENVTKPYRTQSAFPDKQGIWSYNEKELYPGDRVKTLLLFYVDVFPGEYTLYYVKSGKMIPIYRFK